MSKLYVAKMVILEPETYSLNGTVAQYTTEDILVKKVPFGYQEVLIGHFFRKGQYLENSLESNNDTCPYRIVNSAISNKLEKGHRQFFIDDFVNEDYPLREATEQDVKDYVDRFDTSTLKTYYDEKEKQKEAIRTEKARKNQSKKKVKQMIKDWHKNRG